MCFYSKSFLFSVRLRPVRRLSSLAEPSWELVPQEFSVELWVSAPSFYQTQLLIYVPRLHVSFVLKKRPSLVLVSTHNQCDQSDNNRFRLQGLFGAIFGVASVVGALVGDAFTSKITWRWRFYISAPVGGVAIIIVALRLDVPARDTNNRSSFNGEAFATRCHWHWCLDTWYGLPTLRTSMGRPDICCKLPTTSIGLTLNVDRHQWNDGRIIALLVLKAVFLAAFVANRIFHPNTATISPRGFEQRSIHCCWCPSN